MSDRSMEEPAYSADSEEWPHNDFASMFDPSSIRDLNRKEIERLTIAAIREHRRRLDRAQSLHDKIEKAGAKDVSELREAYGEAMQAHDTHHMVVQMLIAILGYIPKTKEKQSRH